MKRLHCANRLAALPCALSACCLSLLLGATASARASELVRLVSAEYPPYFGASLQYGGVITNIITQAFRRNNYTVQVQYLPWARALAEAREGKVDGMVAMPENHDEALHFAYSAPILHLQLGFYKQRERQIEFRELPELKAYKIGTVRGYPNPAVFTAAQLSNFDSLDDSTNLRKLALGRVDLALTDRLVGKYLLETRLSDMRVELGWQGVVIANPTQHLAFAKKHAGYEKKLHALNDGLLQMQQDGSLKEILRQAGIEQTAN